MDNGQHMLGIDGVTLNISRSYALPQSVSEGRAFMSHSGVAGSAAEFIGGGEDVDGILFKTMHCSGLSANNGGTFGGGVNMIDNELSRPKLKDYGETVNAIGTITSDTTVNFENGNVQTVTVNGGCTFSFSNPPSSGVAGTVTLILTNGGSQSVSFHSSVKWPGDVAPTLTTSGVDILSFLTTDAGSNIYGFVGGINFS